MMKAYQNPTMILLTLTREDVLAASGELTPLGIEGESEEIFGGFTPYR